MKGTQRWEVLLECVAALLCRTVACLQRCVKQSFLTRALEAANSSRLNRGLSATESRTKISSQRVSTHLTQFKLRALPAVIS